MIFEEWRKSGVADSLLIYEHAGPNTLREVTLTHSMTSVFYWNADHAQQRTNL